MELKEYYHLGVETSDSAEKKQRIQSDNHRWVNLCHFLAVWIWRSYLKCSWISNSSWIKECYYLSQRIVNKKLVKSKKMPCECLKSIYMVSCLEQLVLCFLNLANLYIKCFFYLALQSKIHYSYIKWDPEKHPNKNYINPNVSYNESLSSITVWLILWEWLSWPQRQQTTDNREHRTYPHTLQSYSHRRSLHTQLTEDKK